MLNLPSEIIYSIIDYLGSSHESLNSLSLTSQQLSEHVQIDQIRKRAQDFKKRLNAIPHVDILMGVWPPQLFFRPNGGTGQTIGGYIGCPADFRDLLYENDDATITSLDEYLRHLEDGVKKAGTIADVVAPRIDISRDLIMVSVIQLCSANVRYAHDKSGHIRRIRDTGAIEGIEDNYVQSLPMDVRSTMIRIYNALCERLKHPSHSEQTMVQGTWLYQYIIWDGIDYIYSRLE